MPGPLAGFGTLNFSSPSGLSAILDPSRKDTPNSQRQHPADSLSSTAHSPITLKSIFPPDMDPNKPTDSTIATQGTVTPTPNTTPNVTPDSKHHPEQNPSHRPLQEIFNRDIETSVAMRRVTAGVPLSPEGSATESMLGLTAATISTISTASTDKTTPTSKTTPASGSPESDIPPIAQNKRDTVVHKSAEKPNHTHDKPGHRSGLAISVPPHSPGGIVNLDGTTPSTLKKIVREESVNSQKRENLPSPKPEKNGCCCWPQRTTKSITPKEGDKTPKSSAQVTAQKTIEKSRTRWWCCGSADE
jgi:hypothetical protein